MIGITRKFMYKCVLSSKIGCQDFWEVHMVSKVNPCDAITPPASLVLNPVREEREQFIRIKRYPSNKDRAWFFAGERHWPRQLA
jgi:hypothetical protein